MSNRSILFLGSSSAYPSEGYLHSSFIVRMPGCNLLVDTMGGYDIIRAFRKHKVSVYDISALFITHPALDHAMGLFWLIHQISIGTHDVRPEGYHLGILCSRNVWSILDQMGQAICPVHWERSKPYISHVEIGDRVTVTLANGSTITGIKAPSSKEEQHGFILVSDGTKLTFSGDEALMQQNFDLAHGSDLLIHEAFCIEADATQYAAREKGHCTALDAARIARTIEAKRLVFIHISHEHPGQAMEFSVEAKKEFEGEAITPESGEIVVF